MVAIGLTYIGGGEVNKGGQELAIYWLESGWYICCGVIMCIAVVEAVLFSSIT